MSLGKTKLRTGIFWLLLLLVPFLALELTLDFLCLVSPRIASLLSLDGATVIRDEKLGIRPNPMFPEHDAKGWRNKSVPGSATIIAMGDSQTYGTNVRSEEAWPKQLGDMVGIETYNIACGGYCPIHTLLLLDEALRLQPKLVIEAFYTGNDLFECYTTVYSESRLPELRRKDGEIPLTLSEKEESDRLVREALRVTKPPWLRTKDFLIEHVKLVAALRLYKSFLPTVYSVNPSWESVKAYANRAPDSLIFEQGPLRTVFTVKSRLLAENLGDRRVREGLRLALESLRRVNERLKQQNVCFLLLSIPTKEYVFEEFVCQQGGNVSHDYDRLVKNERTILETVAEFSEANGIHFVSALPVLRECLSNGDQPYRLDDDGHPNPAGHRAIAKAVQSKIRQLGLAK